MGITSSKTPQEKFHSYIERGDLEKLQKLDYSKIDIHVSEEAAFIKSCKLGRSKIVKFLIKLGEDNKEPIDIHAQEDSAFLKACGESLFSIAKYLIQLGENGYGKMNIHVGDEYAFRCACGADNLDFMKYLINLGENGYGRIDIHARNESAFKKIFYRSMYLSALPYLLHLSRNGYGNIDVNCDGGSIFEEIVKYGQREELIYLIDLYESYTKKRFNFHVENDKLPWMAFDRRQFEIFDYFIKLANECGYGYILSDGIYRYSCIGEYYSWKPVNGSRKLFRLTIASNG